MKIGRGSNRRTSDPLTCVDGENLIFEVFAVLVRMGKLYFEMP